MQKEYTRNTISPPRCIRTSNCATFLYIFSDFISRPKLLRMAERTPIWRLLLNLNSYHSVAIYNNHVKNVPITAEYAE